MREIGFLSEIGGALIAALIGGSIARLLRLPVLVGYIIVGVAAGIWGQKLFGSMEEIHLVAKFGVILLMFAVGVQFSLKDLNEVRNLALIGGIIQIVLTVGLGWLIGSLFGLNPAASVLLGFAIAISSTAVMMRVLEERGELGSSHGSAMLGILVVQDLSVVLMVGLLPTLNAIAKKTETGYIEIGSSLALAFAFIAGTLFLATRIVPYLLDRVARLGSRELFLIFVVCIGFSAAVLSTRFDLSVELGAFLAGLVISESDYATEAFSQVRPLRDVFAAIFFVAVGMMLNPSFIIVHWQIYVAVTLAVLIGKAFITSGALAIIGVHSRTATLSGLGLANIGEFSFVLAALGVSYGIITDNEKSVIIATALTTMLLTPFIYGNADGLYRGLRSTPLFSPLFNRKAISSPEPDADFCPDGRVVILGSGRIGRYVAKALTHQKIKFIVIDIDANTVKRQRRKGTPIIYGDATSEVVIRKARPECAQLAIVALPEADAAEMSVLILKRIAPKLHIIARVHRGVDIPRMRKAGADAIIHAEFEAGIEMIRLCLDKLNVPNSDADTYVDMVRQEKYQQKDSIFDA